MVQGFLQPGFKVVLKTIGSACSSFLDSGGPLFGARWFVGGRKVGG